MTDIVADMGVGEFNVKEAIDRMPGTYLFHAKFMYVKYPGLNFLQY